MPKSVNPARIAVRDAITAKHFPPSLCYPEAKRNSMLSEWFKLPTLTWVPEVLNTNRLPVCTTKNCKCTPKVKEYLNRTVHDVQHKTKLYYARYSCCSGCTFTTIDDSYLSSSKEVLLAFPYFLTYQSGISLSFFDLVYDSMLTTKGLAGATDNITRRRQKRYYNLLVLAASEIEKRKAANAAYSPPLLQSVEQYMTKHACLDSETLQKVWLAQTEICFRLLEANMATSEYNKVIRVDHSQKFCSKLKVFEADGSKNQASSVRMLLLVQNEIGQVIARGCTLSENHKETEAILEPVAAKLTRQPTNERFCVCDNANGMRNLVRKLFGGSVTVKQDPFHVIQRITEKISDQVERSWIAKCLSNALFDMENNLRAPNTMAKMFADAVAKVQPSSIRVPFPEWEGCISSNLEQIVRGDLYVENSSYMEGGRSVRIVSTSQLEAIHSKLRKLLDRIISIQVGLRILDIFLLQHNLKVGAKFKRNPEFSGFDFITLSRSSLLCRGIYPDMPQLEYVNQLLASQPTDISLQHYYRPGGGEVPINRPWEILYDMIPLCADRAEGNLLRNDFVQNDIRKLLCSVNHGREKMTQRDFVENLGIESEYENCAEFSSHEFTLLKMLRREQLAAKFYKWASCEVVTTILYNTAVRRLDNPNLDIKPRGYRAIVRRLSPIDIQISQNPQMQVSEDKSGVMTLKINPTINDDINLPSEKALQEELFELLRLPVGIKHVKQVYKAVYDFAACTCVGINRKSDEFLDRRWDSLRRAVSYKNAKHIRGGIQVSKTIEQIPNAEALSTCKSQRSMVTMITSSNESSSITSSIPTSVPCPETRSCSSIPPRYEILDLATLDALLDHAASFRKGTHGKWHSIMALYSQMNPTGNMDLNKLRCRLNGERLRRSQSKSFESNKTTNQAVSVTHLPQEAPSGREQQHQSVVKDTRAACPSCNKRKRGCGPNSTNPSCEYRNKAQKQTITSYFTSN